MDTEINSNCKEIEPLPLEEMKDDDNGKVTGKTSNLFYGIEDVPSFANTFVLAFQHFIILMSSQIATPLIVADIIYVKDQAVRAHMIGSTFFLQGATTLLQTTFGCRLPLVQGASFSFLPAVVAMCGNSFECHASRELSSSNSSMGILNKTHEEEAQDRLNMVNGALIMASAVQLIIGVSGLLGLISRFIGPIPISSCIVLLGISICQASAKMASTHWGVSIFTATAITIFSQCLKNVNVPVISIHVTRSSRPRIGITTMKIFLLFPIFLGMMLGWLFSWILSVTGALSDDPSDPSYRARTDIHNELQGSPWFQIPLPGQDGLPTFTWAGIGMIAGTLASIVESIGDYSACSHICEIPKPPAHAVNRGIAVEGLGSLLGGLWGTGVGSASYSSNLVAIGITQVASRRVIQVVGIMMLAAGLFQKFNAVLSTIPDPVLGGVLVSSVGMLVSVGMSFLQKVDMGSSRNLYVLGISFFFGITLPEYVKQYPISTGSLFFNMIAGTLLGTGMFVGGLIACILDNILPGGTKERGIEPEDSTTFDKSKLKSYDLPCGDRWKTMRLLRFCPLFPNNKETVIDPEESTNLQGRETAEDDVV